MRVLTDPSSIEPYLRDESRMPGGAASAIWVPDSTEELRQAICDARAQRQPVTVAGAGTGITGGRIPAGGVVISTERLTAVRSLGESIVCGAGTTLATVFAAAQSMRRFYPPDPTEWSASIGGTFATNASGARSFAFGATRRWVQRAVVLLIDGTVLDLSRGAITATRGSFTLPDGRRLPAPDWNLPRTSKHAAGYYSMPSMDLIDLFIGSEGTLGVVAEVQLATIPAPQEILGGLLFFSQESDAFGLVRAARARQRSVEPLALEFFDAAALNLARTHDPQVPAAAAAIFFEQLLTDASREQALEGWIQLAEQHAAHADSWLGQGGADQARFRDLRHAVPVAINRTLARRGVTKVATDSALPLDRTESWLAQAREWLDRQRLEHVAFGHVGDEHLHVNILARDAEQVPEARAAFYELTRRAVAAGGTVSAEHGLGKLKRDLLRMMYPDEVLARMQQIKHSLDPEMALGQGTLLP
ncbi:MAG: FAD-binding oxidoreductase [Acidobacteriota bacterium]